MNIGECAEAQSTAKDLDRVRAARAAHEHASRGGSAAGPKLDDHHAATPIRVASRMNSAASA